MKQKPEEVQRLLNCQLQTKPQLTTCTCMCVRRHDTCEHYVKATQIWFFR